MENVVLAATALSQVQKKAGNISKCSPVHFHLYKWTQLKTLPSSACPTHCCPWALQPQQVGLSAMVGVPMAMEMWQSHRTGDVSCNMVGGQFWMLWGCWERREGRDILLGTGIPPVLMGHQRADLPQGPGFPALNLSLL